MAQSIKQQLHRHFVAILSLLIAITALSYETWRNEVSEKNRNTRVAAFEVLKQLGDLQLIVNYAHYQKDQTRGNPLMGWGHVSMIGDLSRLLPDPVPQKADQLVKVWRENGDGLQTNEESAEKISQEIDASREAVVQVLYKLK